MARQRANAGFRLAAAAFICLWTSAYTAFAQNSDPLAIRISCGSWQNTYRPVTNKLWGKDHGYTGGSYANATGTSYIAPQLKKLRFFKPSDGPENCYNITNLPDGHYSVRMFFGLNKDVLADREPLFDVSIEGTQVYSLKSGWSVNDDQSYLEASVFVSDTAATACFHSTGHGDPSVMSIEILQLHPEAYYFGAHWRNTVIFRTAKRVDCGAGSRGVYGESYNANPWGGDRFWFSDTEPDVLDRTLTRRLRTSNSIRYTSVAPNFYPGAIYQSASRGSGVGQVMNYRFKVEPNANYSVCLHFAEIEDGVRSAGQRVFDVLINGQLIFSNVDIVRMAGGPFAAVVLNRTVAVHGRTLTLSFNPQRHSTAIVNAIEIFQVIEMEKRTSDTEGAGGVLLDSDGKRMSDYAWGIGKQTNNAAKWLALIKGIELARENNVQDLMTIGDSLIVIQEARALIKNKHQPSFKYHYQFSHKIKELRSISLRHILRINNQQADSMANIGARLNQGVMVKNGQDYTMEWVL